MSDYANIQRLESSQKLSKAIVPLLQILLCYPLQYRLPLVVITESRQWQIKPCTLDSTFNIF